MQTNQQDNDSDGDDGEYEYCDDESYVDSDEEEEG